MATGFIHMEAYDDNKCFKLCHISFIFNISRQQMRAMLVIYYYGNTCTCIITGYEMNIPFSKITLIINIYLHDLR